MINILAHLTSLEPCIVIANGHTGSSYSLLR